MEDAFVIPPQPGGEGLQKCQKSDIFSVVRLPSRGEPAFKSPEPS